MIATSLLANEETVIQTQANHITVYTNTAEISRNAEFSLIKGRQTIVFDSLSPSLLSNSIQAQGFGDFIILDVQFRMKQPDPLNPSANQLPPRIQKEIILLQDSIRIIGYTTQDYLNQLEVLNTEKSLLLNNQLIKGNGGDTIPELKQTLEFFRNKLNNINSEILRLTREIYPYNQEIARMNNRLNSLKSYNKTHNLTPVKQAVPQILVEIIAENNSNGKIELSYLVNNAGWYASYDIRASDKEDIYLIYKANVYQNTGNNWEDVPLTLSTLNPQQQYSKPILPIWYTSYTPVYVNQNRPETKKEYSAKPRSQGSTIDMEEERLSGSAWQYTQAMASMLNVEYKINLDFNIPSDGQYHTVPLQNKKLGSEFTYYAAPKLDNKAYLMASITDWQNLDLLQGQANIYFNGRYTGQTTIYPYTAKDSLELTLGRANGIILDRKRLEGEEKPQLVGSWVTQTEKYQITIRNNNTASVKLKIEDIIPHSTDKNIEIKLISYNEAKFNDKNSHLNWDLELPANSSKTIEFEYSIKYNKDEDINLVFN